MGVVLALLTPDLAVHPDIPVPGDDDGGIGRRHRGLDAFQDGAHPSDHRIDVTFDA